MDVLFVVLVLATSFAWIAQVASASVGVAAKFKLLFGYLLLLAIVIAVGWAFFMLDGLPDWLLTLLLALMMAGLAWVITSPYYFGFRAYYEQEDPEFFANHDLQRQHRKFRVYLAVACPVIILMGSWVADAVRGL